MLKGITHALPFALLLAAVCLLVAPTPGHAQEPKLTKQCVDFSDWEEGEVELKFTKDGFVFTALDDEPQLIYLTDTPKVPGLQIAEKGVNISFPQTTSRVTLSTVLYTSRPLEISAFNPEGATVTKVTTPPGPEDTIHTVSLTGRDMVRLVISGGGGEGVLVEICIEIEAEQIAEEARITGVNPPQGRCGSEITLIVFGANFEEGSSVSISDDIKTIHTKFMSPEELQVGIFIAEDASPGPRPVTVFVPELGKATLEEGFTVICPALEPERQPDLALLEPDWEIVEEDRLLLIVAQVENVGDARAPRAIVQVASQVAEWTTETIIPELDSGDSFEILFELEIPDELQRRSQVFRVRVDPDDTIAEWRDDNNWQDVEVWVPEELEPEEREADLVPFILIVVVVAAITGTTLTVRRSIKVRRRKEWHDKAKEEEPPETCQPCTRCCRKIELKLEPALHKIAHLSLSAYDPVSGEKSKERQVRGESVDELNNLIRTRRQREEPRQLQKQVATVAGALLLQIMEWLRSESASRDVSIVGHLEGGKVTFQFILYHCKRRGTVNIWEEEDKWKETVKDERDEPVGILRSLDPVEPEVPEWLALELTRLLMQLTEKV